MKLINIPVSGLFENVYLYFDEYLKKGVIVDPGGMADKIIETLNDYDISITAILLTHGHYDHIAAIDDIKNATGAPVYAHKDEANVLLDPKFNFSEMALGKPISITPDIWLKDNDIIELADIGLRVIHTPGHTSGSVCYFDYENFVLFSGDTLFFESVGRTDFPTGNANSLISSIKYKLFELPEDTVVYPGHYHKTSIKHEKLYNPFLDL